MNSIIEWFKNDFWATIKTQFSPVAEKLPDNMLLILTLTLISAVLMFSQSKKYTGYITTVFHEAGHALAALTVGGRVSGIKIRRDQSGETGTLTSRFLPFTVWISWWGYPTPAILGGIYVWASTTGYQKTALFLTLILMVVLWFNIRSFYAFIWITFTMMSVWAIWWLLPNYIMSIILFTLGSMLIFGGIESLINLTKIHSRGRKEEIEHSDAYHLQKHTFIIPAFIWLTSFWLATVTATIKTLSIFLNF